MVFREFELKIMMLLLVNLIEICVLLGWYVIEWVCVLRFWDIINRFEGTF